jgi:hypothetical protein
MIHLCDLSPHIDDGTLQMADMNELRDINLPRHSAARTNCLPCYIIPNKCHKVLVRRRNRSDVIPLVLKHGSWAHAQSSVCLL